MLSEESAVKRESERWDVFLSYRPCDREVACELYDQLSLREMKVYMDYFCLQQETDYAWEIAYAMARSDVVITVISRSAIYSPDKPFQNFESLVETSRPDQLLIEYRLALELLGRKAIHKVCPLFVGIESIICDKCHTNTINNSHLIFHNQENQMIAISLRMMREPLMGSEYIFRSCLKMRSKMVGRCFLLAFRNLNEVSFRKYHTPCFLSFLPIAFN